MSKKTRFGYLSGIGRLHNTSHDWFDASTFLVEGIESLPEEEEEKPKFTWVKVGLFVILLVLGGRLTQLQVVQGSQNSFLAQGNRARQQIIVAPRGIIVDRTGAVLATNEPGYSVELIPADIPRKKDEREAFVTMVAQTLKMPEDDIAKQVQRAGFSSLDPVSLQANVPRELALAYRLKFANQAGVRVSYVPTRKYDTTPGLSHLLGYVSKMTEKDMEKHPEYSRSAPIGRSGVESSYDERLRGLEGINQLEVNAQGRFQRVLTSREPQTGSTLKLTLDKGLQAEMAAALQEAMQKNGAKQAVGVAMDPKTGGILASVSLPTYDNNLFAKGISQKDYDTLSNNPDKPLLNRAVDGLYPPGSTIKPFVAAAALQEKTITPTTRLDTSDGKITIGQWTFPDWKIHDMTDVKQAIAESNNIFFYALGGGWENVPGLGSDRLKSYLEKFGFGKNTGVDYTNDKAGVIPNPDWKKKTIKESWYVGDTYHMSIGQGYLLSTPMQLATALSAVVNGGRIVTPHVVDAELSPDTGEETKITFEEKRLAMDEAALQTVREGMRQTVASSTGSARVLQSLPFTSAGKTGTAQFRNGAETHAWYIGYAPSEDPKIVVAILVEGGGEGNAISVPVAGRVFSHYMRHQ